MPSLYETLKGHVRCGHHITVILPQYVPFGDQMDRIEVTPGIEYDIFIAPCCWLPAVKAIRRAISRLFGSNEFPFFIRWILNMTTFLLLTISMFFMAIRVRYRLKRNFDLIYAHNQNTALAGLFLRLLWRIPNVTRLYGTFLADLMNRPLVWLRYPVAAAGYLVPSNMLICGNDGTRGDEVAEKLGVSPERFRFWQNGIDPPASPPCTTREDFINHAPPNLRLESIWVCSCSRLSYWKRTDRILKALQISRQADQDCQLLLAGDGPERENLIKMVKEMDLENDVIWLGPLPHDDIWKLMNLSDIFIIANDVTNRCNPLYEAIYASLPVVSIHDRSTSDLLTDGENSLLADREEPEKLGHCLIKLCQNSEKRKYMGLAQKSVAKTFWSWEERIAQEVRELEALVSRHKGNC